MLKARNEQKDKINILLNPDNFYGKHTGGLGRILLFCVAACAPFLVYTMLLINFIPFRFFLIPFIPYCIKMFLITVGREKQKMESFKKRLNDQYSSSKELIKFSDVHEDGCIEYQNGVICYIIQAYGFSYMSDNQYSKDLEGFLSRITSQYEVDVYGHLVTGELDTTQEDLEGLRVYEDGEFMKERLEFYKYQDKYTDENSKLYRLNFVVRSYKTQWGKLSKYLNNLVKSEYVSVFDQCHICNKEEAIAVMSRDATIFIDVGEMLRTSHNSENYYGSKILYYGDEVPDNLKEKTTKFEEEEGRRVIDDT